MPTTLSHAARTCSGVAVALSLVASLGGCGGIPTNRSLESVHQPVVERINYTLDVTTGPGGLSLPEERRLAGWFDALELRYGDRIAIDDPVDSGATRGAVEALASRHGLLVGEATPITAGTIVPGTARVIVIRSKATVPGCPDWGGKSDANFHNATSNNYGCAVNANLAAMVADPEHLIQGATSPGDTVVMSSNKAIGTYREAKPTGEGGLKDTSTNGK